MEVKVLSTGFSGGGLRPAEPKQAVLAGSQEGSSVSIGDLVHPVPLFLLGVLKEAAGSENTVLLSVESGDGLMTHRERPYIGDGLVLSRSDSGLLLALQEGQGGTIVPVPQEAAPQAEVPSEETPSSEVGTRVVSIYIREGMVVPELVALAEGQIPQLFVGRGPADSLVGNDVNLCVDEGVIRCAEFTWHDIPRQQIVFAAVLHDHPDFQLVLLRPNSGLALDANALSGERVAEGPGIIVVYEDPEGRAVLAAFQSDAYGLVGTASESDSFAVEVCCEDLVLGFGPKPPTVQDVTTWWVRKDGTLGRCDLPAEFEAGDTLRVGADISLELGASELALWRALQEAGIPIVILAAVRGVKLEPDRFGPEPKGLINGIGPIVIAADEDLAVLAMQAGSDCGIAAVDETGNKAFLAPASFNGQALVLPATASRPPQEFSVSGPGFAMKITVEGTQAVSVPQQ